MTLSMMEVIRVIGPYQYVRLVTILLGTFWTVAGLLRLLRFGRRWENRIHLLGVSRAWFRRQILIMVARSTVLDPLNALLFAILVGLWTLGGIVRGGGFS